MDYEILEFKIFIEISINSFLVKIKEGQRPLKFRWIHPNVIHIVAWILYRFIVSTNALREFPYGLKEIFTHPEENCYIFLLISILSIFIKN